MPPHAQRAAAYGARCVLGGGSHGRYGSRQIAQSTSVTTTRRALHQAIALALGRLFRHSRRKKDVIVFVGIVFDSLHCSITYTLNIEVKKEEKIRVGPYGPSRYSSVSERAQCCFQIATGAATSRLESSVDDAQWRSIPPPPTVVMPGFSPSY